MSNPTPTGDHYPGQTPAAYPGSAEPHSHTQGAEQTPQWNAANNPAYGAPPPYQPYPPQYQPYQQAYQPTGAAPAPGYPPQYVPGMNPTNPLAIASLIVSLIGIGIVGVILGHIALSQINRSNGYEQGRGLAIAGLIIGYAQIALGLIFVIIFFIAFIAASTSVPTN